MTGTDRPRVDVVGLGPAGASYLTRETLELLGSGVPVWLRTSRHPAAEGIAYDGTFDALYDSADRFDTLYPAIVERLVDEARAAGRIVYAVPGSPAVAERTVELLRTEVRVDVVVHPALGFLDLAWSALAIDPMSHGVTIVDAHRFLEGAAGRLGPFLVTQVHSTGVLADLVLDLSESPPETVTILHALGTSDERVTEARWGELDDVEPDHLTSVWIPRLDEPVAPEFARFDELVRTLRAECPWDREQTHGSLRRFLLEETYEVIDAIELVVADPDSGYPELEEELGDLLFQVFFHARLAAEAGWFGVADVARGIHDKLHDRHPHVFGDADPHDTINGWERAKQDEKNRASVMDGIPSTLPALLHALKVQKRAASTGFSGTDLDWALADVADELAEVTADPSEHEVGDLLYAVVQVARMLDVDPEMALRGASDRFARRFRRVEARAAADDLDLAQLDLATLGDLWAEAKRIEADQGPGR